MLFFEAQILMNSQFCKLKFNFTMKFREDTNKATLKGRPTTALQFQHEDYTASDFM